MKRRILAVMLMVAGASWSVGDEERMGAGLGQGTVRDMRLQGPVGLPKAETQKLPSFIDSTQEPDKVNPQSVRTARIPEKRATQSTSLSVVQRMARNLGNELEVFGMDFFSNPSTTYAPLDQVSPPADYRISVGDALDIKVWGAVTMIQRVLVDASGQIFLPQVGPISVAGKRYGEIDAFLRTAIGRQFRGFEVQASLAHQKSLQIYVTGAVRSPGAYTVSGFSSLVNALLVSGGPTTEGSLRRIELRRGGALVGTFDLYGLLLDGDKSLDLSLQAGDVIHIPPVQGQVAIVNGVLKPAVYEIKPGESLHSIVRWAGGLGLDADARDIRRERVAADSGLKVERFAMVDSGKGCILRDGDIFYLSHKTQKFENAVTLRGHSRLTGRFPWKQGMRIRDLLPQVSDLIPDKFWLQMNSLPQSADIAAVPLERRLDLNWEYAMVQRMVGDSLRIEVIPFNLGNAMRDASSADNMALQPGDAVTVFSATDIAVPVRFRPIYVRLEGEVQRGGLYKARFGETLRDVVARAGGLSKQAYVYGAKFLRKSTAEVQRVNYRQVVDEMQRQFEGNVANILGSASTPEESRLLQNQVDAQRRWFIDLKSFEPEGRLVLELKPSTDLELGDIPEIPLEDGDVLSIPSVPSTIGVFGEVARQSAFLYREGKDVGDYLSSAGGAAKHGDPSAAFVIRADGTLVGEADYGFLFWQLSSMTILPGDALVMPRKLESSRWLVQLKDWSQILANFGLSAAAIATLNRGF